MSNICAAIGLGQLTVLSERVVKKREIFNFYKSDLQGFYQYRNINTAIKTIAPLKLIAPLLLTRHAIVVTIHFGIRAAVIKVSGLRTRCHL